MAALAAIVDLVELQTPVWSPAMRHACYAGHEHPINFNLGKIHGGEWASSVPTTCRVDFRFGIYPGRDPAEALNTAQNTQSLRMLIDGGVDLRRMQSEPAYAMAMGRRFYNADLLKAAGLDPDSPPKTWEAVKQAAIIGQQQQP